MGAGCCCCCGNQRQQQQRPLPPPPAEVPVKAQQLVDDEEKRKREEEERKRRQKELEEEEERKRKLAEQEALLKKQKEDEENERLRVEREKQEKIEQINKKFIEELNKHKTELKKEQQTANPLKEVEDLSEYERKYQYLGKQNELLGPIIREPIKSSEPVTKEIQKISINDIEVIQFYQSTPYSITTFVKYQKANYFMKTIYGNRKEDVEKSIKAIQDYQKVEKRFPILFYCQQEYDGVIAVSLLSKIAEFNIFQFSSQPMIKDRKEEYRQRRKLASSLFQPSLQYTREYRTILKPTNILIIKREAEYSWLLSDSYYFQNDFTLIQDKFIHYEFDTSAVEKNMEAALPIIQSLMLLVFQIDILSCEKMGQLNTFCESEQFRDENMPDRCDSIYNQLKLLDKLIKEKQEQFKEYEQGTKSEPLANIWKQILESTKSGDFHIEKLNQTINYN